ncbi:type I-E CRISPR-associated protein Cse1/CasA [Desulfotignum balticum]|jgi:CRISPR system Cascade subunit CasA|uniref:type I-E CRISPR-associated protein Cse1/CasA n=1 Tax=Desulfotignum balticum TaxID=115781 RepID=UPI0004219240|nr:type I-E CRISPR-associated protein Cse1/CasA [Desulfotignum balticum]
MKNRFNLIEEPWIPVADIGRISLEQFFSNLAYRRLGGNSLQKIALFKFLLAIAQAAATPADEFEWEKLTPQVLADQCLNYLVKWHDRFFLYGEKPFLQLPEISMAREQSEGALIPEIATGNTTVLFNSQVEQRLGDADRALLLLVLMGSALGGKKTDNSVVLTKAYKGKNKDNGKPTTGKPGPAVAHMGLMHNFILGNSLIQTLLLNLLTAENISEAGIFSGGLGTAPWEKMPEGEDCPVAQLLKKSLLGRLIPVCRFCLFTPNGVHYSEGISHMNYLDGIYDPSIAIDTSGNKNKVLWVDPEKRPWRQLPALLGFIKQGRGNFDCMQLRISLPRAGAVNENFAVWSAGLRVSSNAGEQYVSGNDDFVESEVELAGRLINSIWFNRLEIEMAALEKIASVLYGCIFRYFEAKIKKPGQLTLGQGFAAQSTNLFWQLIENHFQKLIDSCGDDPEFADERYRLRQQFSKHIYRIYDHFCPRDTARQMETWAKCRPNLSTYLKKEEKQ